MHKVERWNYGWNTTAEQLWGLSSKLASEETKTKKFLLCQVLMYHSEVIEQNLQHHLFFENLFICFKKNHYSASKETSITSDQKSSKKNKPRCIQMFT